jgi:hypothetical protein
LWGHRFVVRTDHRSLRFLLDQRLTTIPQHQWVSKLLGFDFVVEYKPGAQNVVADALSRRDEGGAELQALSAPQFSLFDDVRQEINGDVELSQLRDAIRGGTKPETRRVVDGLILFKGRVFISAHSGLRQAILELVHGTGHEGVHKMLHRLRADFHLIKDRVAVQEFVRACAVCQQNKTEHLQPGGLLQPLGVLTSVCADLAMDFVKALPRVNGKSVILTVVDRFTKAAHFIPLGHPYSATSVARAFFAEVVRLHGIPSSIVSDRDPVFPSAFWRELFRLAGVKLQMSSAFHPQSDGQSEATNKIIAMYLRCLTGDRPRQWVEWLPWVEFCYRISKLSRPRHLSWYMGGHLLPSGHILQGMPGCLRWIRRCGRGMNFWLKFVTVWSRHNSITRRCMTAAIVRFSSCQGSGFGSGYCTVR